MDSDERPLRFSLYADEDDVAFNLLDGSLLLGETGASSFEELLTLCFFPLLTRVLGFFSLPFRGPCVGDSKEPEDVC